MMMAQFRDQIIQLWTRFFDEVVFITGLWVQQTQLLLWALAGVLVLTLLLIPLHKWLKRKKIWLQKWITTLVDEMIYLSALAQSQSTISLKTLGGNPHISLMQTIWTKGKGDYIKSDFLILDTLHKVEQILGQKIISPEQEALLLQQTKRFRILRFCELLVKVVISIPTLWLYALLD